MRREHRVLTPESVEFVYEVAGLGSRMAAVLLDHLILLGLVVAVATVAILGGLMACFASGLVQLGPSVVAALGTLLIFLVYFGYFVILEWKWNGQTPGKRVMDLRVIDDRGMNVDLLQCVLRNLFRAADMLPFLFVIPPFSFLAVGLYAIGGSAALISPRGKRLGDWAAGTLVVRTRKRVMPSAIIAANEKYNSLQEDGALRARIRRRLGLEERETLFQLCLRRGELEFEARQALFVEAAAYLEERLELERESFLSEEKFVQNIAAVALDAQETASLSGTGPRTGLPTAQLQADRDSWTSSVGS